MNKRELLHWLSDKPDDLEIRFSTEGYSHLVGHALYVPEWGVIYLGVNKDDLADSLSDEMEMEADEDNTEEENLLERDAFLQALENAENAKENILEGVECCAIEVCKPRLSKGTEVLNSAIGVM